MSLLALSLMGYKFKRHSLVTHLLLWTAIGFAAAQLRCILLNTNMLHTSQKAVFWGIIESVEDQPDKTRLILRPQVQPQLPEKVRLTDRSDKNLAPGDRIHVSAKLWAIPEPAHPLAYDFRRTAYFQGIGAIGQVQTIDEIQLHQKTTFETWRYKLTQTLREQLSPPYGHIASALITGDRSGIDNTLRQAYADAGIAHILAISGLHLSIVAGLVFLLLRRGFSLIPTIAQRYPIKKWAALGAIVFTALYLSISGFAVPAKRAFIMTSVVLLGIITDRQGFSMRSLSIAALIILLIWPEVLLSASFQLSFAAVIALIAAYGLWDQYRPYTQRWWLKPLIYMTSIIFSTLIATAATTPFTIHLFHRFTLQAILGNLLAIPLTALWIMPSAVLSLFSLLFGGWHWCFKIWEWGLTGLNMIADRIAHLPGAAILIPSQTSWFMACVILGGLWLCLWTKKWRYWGLAPLSLSLACLSLNQKPDIMVSTDGKVMAFAHENQLMLSQRDKFYEESWLKLTALKDSQIWDQPLVHIGAIALINQRGKRMPYSKIMKACQNHRWVVTNGSVPQKCKQISNVIDYRKLKNDGGLVMWLNEKHDPEHILQHRQRRPWTDSADSPPKSDLDNAMQPTKFHKAPSRLKGGE